ncbi:hypothetical protein [Streptomyces auratus]|uniref:Uncharacterized protein n=1 Tax=Streptomyces auratus AGR0001 TaxID=1160718 RepID=J1RH23_9ACTN|nr:hypothetical protein [Streptomyces auratus]QTZ90076.1 hypothetical protein SU9_000265 [Streptomyces auratus AGR0001]
MVRFQAGTALRHQQRSLDGEFSSTVRGLDPIAASPGLKNRRIFTELRTALARATQLLPALLAQTKLEVAR